MNPSVSVLIPVFNREAFLDEAIESVVRQDFADFELLVVDDGSTDGSPAILRRWAGIDDRIVVITAPENEGIPSALNRGLARARGRYVARLDSDDVMMPGRLSAQAAVLDTRPDVVLVSTAYEFINVAGEHLGIWPGDEPHEVMVYLLNFFNIVGGGGQVMFRTDEVMAEGGYSVQYPSSEDYDLWVRLLRRGRILTLPMVGMKQRDHPARSDVQYGANKRTNWYAIMGDGLVRYLGRPVRDEEIAALITVWRLDGVVGMAPQADATMREAFSRFCRENPDPDLQRIARERTALQWIAGSHLFGKRGAAAEAEEYSARAESWKSMPPFLRESKKGSDSMP